MTVRRILLVPCLRDNFNDKRALLRGKKRFERDPARLQGLNRTLKNIKLRKTMEKNAFRVLLQAATWNDITVEFPLADVHLAGKSCQSHLSKLSFAR